MFTGKLKDGQYVTEAFWRWWHEDDARLETIQKQNKIIPWVHPDWYKGTTDGRTKTDVQHASGTTGSEKSAIPSKESKELGGRISGPLAG